MTTHKSITTSLKKKHFLSWMKKLKKPDEIFNLLISTSYSCGKFGADIPVDETRDVFEHIKKLLNK